jgi:hypothetical protein
VSNRDPNADLVSTILLPSFVMWRAGTLLAVPFDVLEFAAVRAWRSEKTLTRPEQEEIELEIDRDTLPTYPVEWVYPARPTQG